MTSRGFSGKIFILPANWQVFVMEYVVFETGGKQYKVGKGQVLEVENLPEVKNGSISFDKVLLFVSDSDVKIGKPYLVNFTVRAKILENLKGEKIRVARFKAKSRYRRIRGHRQSLSRIQIQDIVKAG